MPSLVDLESHSFLAVSQCLDLFYSSMALQKSFQANVAYEASLDVVLSQTCFEIDGALMYYQTHISNFAWNCWRVSADSGDAFIW